MSIIIKGMEMPKENEILVFDMWHGKIYARSITSIGSKFYEVVPLQEWHGRLVDAERFRVILCRLKERQNDNVATNALNWAIECLDKMDTIIPAEGGTDECSEN